MELIPLAIEGVVLIKPRRFEDERGWFEETWSARRMAEAGLPIAFVQDNQSLSVKAGTLRGLHFQRPPHAQAKLVRVGQGAVLDVAVDLRRSSPTYGRWVSAELSAANGAQLFVPRGFAHGFVTHEPDTMVLYKVDGHYDKASELGIRFDDPDLSIDWQIGNAQPMLSEKDRVLPRLADLPPIFE